MKAATTALAAAIVIIASGCGASVSSPLGSGTTTASDATGSATPATTPPATQPVSSVSWNLAYEPASLDPIKTQLFVDAPVESNMCESLLQVRPDLSIAPFLASSFHQIDPLTWVYHLRSDVRFWDGSPMTSADVVASLRRNLDPKAGSYWSLEYENVRSIEASGPGEVIIHFIRPDALLNQALATSAGAISKAAAVAADGANYGSAKNGLMCTGPFKFGSWVPGSSITLLRNDQYWNASAKPLVKKLVFQFISDPSTIASALSTGQIAGMYELPAATIPELRANAAGRFYMGPSTASLDLIPTEKPGPLHDANVRLALFEALDRQAIASGVYYGAAEPARSFINPGVGYGKPIYQSYLNSRPPGKVNLAGAKSLVEHAGSNALTPIRLAVSPDPSLGTVANAIAAAGGTLGLKITVVTLTAAENDQLYFDEKLRDQYDAFLNVQWTLTTDPLEEMEFVTKGAFTNYGLYNNPQFQQLFYQALGISDPTKRAQAAVRALKVVDAEMPWVPIVSLPVTLFVKNGLTGIPTGWSFLYSGWARGLGGA